MASNGHSADSRSDRWYVVQTQPHKDHGVVSQLLAQNFRPFLPQMLRTVRHARKMRTVRTPLFPGYVFVRLDLDRDRWRSVNGTFGVVRLIMNGDLPAPAPVGVVEALQAGCDRHGTLANGVNLAVGAKVRIILGPLADSLGVIDRLDENGRVRVLIDLMNCQVPVRLPRSALRSAA
jgi:transcriptional antiterminator RfaH